MAKALLHPCLTKAGRTKVHEIFLEELDKPEAQELGFAGTVTIALSRAKKQGAIVDFIVHPTISEATASLPQEVQALMATRSQSTPREEWRAVFATARVSGSFLTTG